jgi:hypothetical protein
VGGSKSSRKKQKFIIKGETVDHVHLYDLPNRWFRKGSTVADHKDEVLKTMQALNYTFEKLTIASNKCQFMLDSVINSKPYSPRPGDVYETIADFVYHYENYAMRTYMFREKVAMLMNAVMNPTWPVGKKVDLDLFRHSAEYKAAKFDSVIKKFDYAEDSPVGKLIKDRNTLTHKLYFASGDHYMRPELDVADDSEDSLKEWFRSWRKNIKEKENLASNAHSAIFDIHHKLAEKIYLRLDK